MQNTTILSNLLHFIPRHKFNRFVKKYDCDKYSKVFTMHDHFVSMLYGVISQSSSLRRLESSYNSNYDSFITLKTRSISKSRMGVINNKDKTVKLYYDVFQHLLSMAINKDKLCKKEYLETDKLVNLIDSSEIKLNSKSRKIYPSKNAKDGSHIKVHVVTDYAKDIPKEVYFSEHNVNDITVAKKLINITANQIYVFDRGYYDFQWWKKIDDAGSLFVTRLKKNSPCNNPKVHNSKFQDKNIISDTTFTLNKRLAKTRKNPYRKRLREVKVKDEYGNILRLVTNDFSSSSETISKLYKARWNIELFFKWIKQNLKIKKFYSYSKNGIKVQILIAMIAYLLLKLMKNNISIKQNFVHFVTICKNNLMKKIQNIMFLFFKPPEQYQYYNYLQKQKIKKLDIKCQNQLTLKFTGH